MTVKEQTILNLRKLKSFHSGSYGADIDMAIKALEHEPRWIPVSERLPKPQEDDGDKDFSDWVLVSIRINPYQSIVCSAYYCFSERKWYLERMGCGVIVAWMPLPEEYKTESEVHCNCTKEEIAKSFIEDVEAVKDLLPRAESEDK